MINTKKTTEVLFNGLRNAKKVVTSLKSYVKNEESVKVMFPVNEDGVVGFEGIWCKHLGESKYEIDNIPFVARDVCLGDIIECHHTTKGLQFKSRVRSGGLCCARVFSTNENFSIIWSQIMQGLSAKWEFASPQRVSIAAKSEIMDEIGKRIGGLDGVFIEITCESIDGMLIV